jgi:hypothetical protein
MSVISISIIESTQQIISGVPRSISLSSNIPATIFYTLNGLDPDINSLVYTGVINLPTNNSSVTLKILATNGIDSSAIISKIYAPSTLGLRKPHDTVIGLTAGVGTPDLFPFGDNGPLNFTTYGKSGGITVDAPDIPNAISDGYDGTATNTSAGGMDKPAINYEFVYSTRNNLGETGNGIGSLPGKITILVPKSSIPQESSKASDKFFNPRAMVIYQDAREQPYDDVSQLNRSYFSLQNTERSRDGSLITNTAFDSSSVTGTFLRSHYNKKDNTITYYYRDSDSGRWIISIEPFHPKNDNIGALYRVCFSAKSAGSQYVFSWIPFMSRRLI